MAAVSMQYREAGKALAKRRVPLSIAIVVFMCCGEHSNSLASQYFIFIQFCQDQCKMVHWMYSNTKHRELHCHFLEVRDVVDLSCCTFAKSWRRRARRTLPACFRPLSRSAHSDVQPARQTNFHISNRATSICSGQWFLRWHSRS